jgi:hypothetical protein
MAMRRTALAGLILVLGAAAGGPVMAQTPAAVHATCAKVLAPAFAKASQNAPQGFGVDCPCVSGYLIGRYGAADAELIVRLFAAAGSGSEKEMEAVSKELGLDRIRAVMAKVGKFQELGRQMNEVCPEIRKP